MNPPSAPVRRGRPGDRAVTGTLVLVVALTACVTAPGPEAEVPAPGTPVTAAPGDVPVTRVLRVGLPAEPIGLDPRLVVDDAGELVARALFEPLVDVNPAGGVVPAAAASWRVSSDGTEYRFALRRQTFHDGRPVTAADHAEAILAAFDAARPPYGREPLLDRVRGAVLDGGDGTPVRGTAGTVLAARGVEVLGTWDLVVRLSEADPRLLHALTDVALAPVPPGTVDDPAFAAQPIGNGPFRMVEPRGTDGFLRLVAVPDHHRAPRVDEVLLQFYPDDADGQQRLADLDAGRLQVARLPDDVLASARERFGTAAARGPAPTTGVHRSTTAAVYAYAFDVTVAPGDDVRLRRAVAAAIDRDAVAEAVGGGAVAADRLLPPVLLPDVAAGPVCGHCRGDPALARELFTAWVEDVDPVIPVPLTLTYPRRTDHAAVAEVVAARLESVLDVRVALRALDLEDLTAALVAGSAGVFRPSLRATLQGAAAASSLLDPAFRATGSRPLAATGWGDEASDALLERLRAGPDREAAARLDAALTDEAVVVPLVWLRQDLVVAPGVRGFALDATGRWWPELVALPAAP